MWLKQLTNFFSVSSSANLPAGARRIVDVVFCQYLSRQRDLQINHDLDQNCRPRDIALYRPSAREAGPVVSYSRFEATGTRLAC